ncbi:MATE efflux family protein [Anaeromyces robustus]|uniref:MATE efflux family protein n=1 Tax=Anaeromyces robustus TaxID=1754192 RepID=A0A1Y1XKT0_9FUNG|nr:MATE efflux family protein [Anaeromyces robustus]|eukprot:ORX86066.1 MATE efflux family protein [Anaeromyces robustus]
MGVDPEKAKYLFGKERISKILLKLAPPIMLAQLIQALYNVIDSFFIGRYSDNGLTALSIIYPLQLLMIALAVGTGVGVNTMIASSLGKGENDIANEYAGTSNILSFIMWFLFAILTFFGMPSYAKMSTNSNEIIDEVIIYGRIVCVMSIAVFFESSWTKVLQANSNMNKPMIAHIIGAIINIILDPILIFGFWIIPSLGIAGAAIATIIGQIVTALIVFKGGYFPIPNSLQKIKYYSIKIYKAGIPNILMQSAYTFYILGLNLILAKFSDQAVTTLGLYYKWQTFFFIPLEAMQTSIVPIISFNYSSGNYNRCKKTLLESIWFGMILMCFGTLCFEIMPIQLLQTFTKDELVLEIGNIGFRIIGISFIPLVTSLIFPVYFQALEAPIKSSILTIIRTVILFVPLGYLFSKLGLNWFWLTYPITEVITTIVGVIFYIQFSKKQSLNNNNKEIQNKELV